MGIVIVVRFEIVHVVDDDADPFGRQLLGDKRAIGLQRLFVQRPRHHVVVGKLDEGVAHLLDGPLVGGLANKDVPDRNKARNDGKTQQKVLEQIVVLRIGKPPGEPPADGDQKAYDRGIERLVGRRDHNNEQVAHGDGKADIVIIAGDHKDGNAGDHHRVKRE